MCLTLFFPAIQMVGSARHCEYPGTGPNTPMDKVLEVAKRNLERTCIILLTVSVPLLLGRACMLMLALRGWYLQGSARQVCPNHSHFKYSLRVLEVELSSPWVAHMLRQAQLLIGGLHGLTL